MWSDRVRVLAHQVRGIRSQHPLQQQCLAETLENLSHEAACSGAPKAAGFLAGTACGLHTLASATAWKPMTGEEIVELADALERAADHGDRAMRSGDAA